MLDNWSKQSGPTEVPSFSIVTRNKRCYRRTSSAWLEDINSSVQTIRYTLCNEQMAPFFSKCISLCHKGCLHAGIKRMPHFWAAIYVVTKLQNQVEFFSFLKSSFLKLIVKGDKETLLRFRSQNHNRNLRTCFKIAHYIKKKTKPKTTSKF